MTARSRRTIASRPGIGGSHAPPVCAETRHARPARRPDAQCPIVAILRGVKPDEIDAIGDALVEAGVTVIEVPLNSPQPVREHQAARERAMASAR